MAGHLVVPGTRVHDMGLGTMSHVLKLDSDHSFFGKFLTFIVRKKRDLTPPPEGVVLP